MKNLALVTADVSHDSATRTKAALESKGHTVTFVDDTDVSTHDFSGYDAIVAIRSNADATALESAAKPLIIGLGQQFAGTYTTGQPVLDLGLVNSIEYVSNTAGIDHITIVNNSHPITDTFSLAAVQVTVSNNWSEYVSSSHAYIGTELAVGEVGTSAEGETTLVAVEAGTSRLTSGTTWARIAWGGFFYAGQTDYTADGKTLLGQAVEWVTETSVRPTTGSLTLSNSTPAIALAPSTSSLTISTAVPVPGMAVPVYPTAANSLTITGGTLTLLPGDTPFPSSGQVRITSGTPVPLVHTEFSFSGTSPQMTGTWEFGDEIFFSVESPASIGSFQGGASFGGRTPFPHFTGDMEMEQYGSFSGLSAAMGFSGQGGGQFSGRSAIIQGGFTLELEQYGSFSGRTPDVRGSFVVDQAGTFSGITPAMTVDFTGDMEQYGSFSGLTPAIHQFINRVDWEEINFSGFTPDMQFSGAIEEDPNISFAGETPPMTGNFFITLLDSTQVGDDTIIRHRRGYDRG